MTLAARNFFGTLKLVRTAILGDLRHGTQQVMLDFVPCASTLNSKSYSMRHIPVKRKVTNGATTNWPSSSQTSKMENSFGTSQFLLLSQLSTFGRWLSIRTTGRLLMTFIVAHFNITGALTTRRKIHCCTLDTAPRWVGLSIVRSVVVHCTKANGSHYIPPLVILHCMQCYLSKLKLATSSPRCRGHHCIIHMAYTAAASCKWLC